MSSEHTINLSSGSVIMYLRKSRSDDPTLPVSAVLSKHEQQLQEYAALNLGGEIPPEFIYREVGSAETIENRPVIKYILRMLERGDIYGVLVIEPQRLSRGDLEDCGRIVNTFRYTRTLVLTPPKIYDLSEEYDRKFFEMELTRGNDYLEYTKKILNRGRIASVKQGNFIGSTAPYGYKKAVIGSGKSAFHTLEINPSEARAVRIMFQMYVHEDKGPAKIAEYLDELNIKPRKSTLWSAAAIRDMLKNPVYIGKIRWNYRKTQRRMVDGKISKYRPKASDDSEFIYVDGKHKRIIDDATFYAALQKGAKLTSSRNDRTLKNPFAGLARCASCGRMLALKRRGTKQTSPASARFQTLTCINPSCTCRASIKYELFEDCVLNCIKPCLTETCTKKYENIKNDDEHFCVMPGDFKKDPLSDECINALKSPQIPAEEKNKLYKSFISEITCKTFKYAGRQSISNELDIFFRP